MLIFRNRGHRWHAAAERAEQLARIERERDRQDKSGEDDKAAVQSEAEKPAVKPEKKRKSVQMLPAKKTGCVR